MKLNITIIILCLLSFNAFGESKNITLKDAIDMAVKSSDDLQIKVNDETKMEMRYHEAKSAIYPHLDGDISWSHYADAPPPIDMSAIGDLVSGMTGNSLPAGTDLKLPSKYKYELDAGITATQVLWAFGKVFTGIKIAKNAFEISKLSKEATKTAVQYNIKVTYNTVKMAEKVLENAKSSYDNVYTNRKILKSRFRVGRAPKGDLIKIEADLASRVPALKEAESNLQLAKRYFKMLIGVEEEIEIILVDDFSTDFIRYSVTDLLNTMERDEPTLKLLSETISLNDNIIGIRKAQFLPTLAAFGSFRYMGNSDEVLVGGDNLDTVGVVGVSLTFPIFSGGEKINQYRQAVIEKTNAEIMLRKAKKGYFVELRNAIGQYNGLVETYKANLRTIKLSKRSYQMTQSRFKSGKESITALNDVERLMSGSRLMASATLMKINNLTAKIEKLASKKEL
jgi:outer membrane protein